MAGLDVAGLDMAGLDVDGFAGDGSAMGPRIEAGGIIAPEIAGFDLRGLAGFPGFAGFRCRVGDST